ncbi:aspartyl/asparaginyl beta-hydroxylase domain-containing protein [Streptomyces sp. NPDC017520]|uniref:aspartyl/asparaginyl beta-hydroxylase domain-containing protein n=1 Tax=Streptomyces sp. NPDC017520 TaxID=3364998 RepID=UPI0037AD3210
MTRSRLLGRLVLDPVRLAQDLARTDRFRYSDAYSEFTCGSWKGSYLCNGTGDLYDTTITEYEGPYQLTDHGQQLPYLMELINGHFRTETMRFARLGRITPGSVMVPHRDYLELKEELVRIHVPLHTSDSCFNSEDETVYHMRQGEVWFIDASRVHSAVSFFTEDRTHLILDFASETVEETLRFDPDPATEYQRFGTSVVQRQPLTDEQRNAILGLSAILGPHNYRDVLGLIIKQYFVSNIAISEVYEFACQIARDADRHDVLERLDWLSKHVLVDRAKLSA